MIRFLKFIGLAMAIELVVYEGIALAARIAGDSGGEPIRFLGLILHLPAVVFTIVTEEAGRRSVYLLGGVLQWLLVIFAAAAISDRVKKRKPNQTAHPTTL